ncbi:hypothetical protein ACFLXU_05665 [Chloroflexota bacterium]
MARAVIKLSKDISPVMRQMSRVIEGFAYRPKYHVAAFRFENMRVLVERGKITIYGAEDESTVTRVIRWIINKINDAQ